MKLSIIVPSIRPENLSDLYNSIDVEDFEMIAIGPYFVDYWSENSIYELKSHCIRSFRSPNSCQQQGLLHATGDYICAAADDGVFIPGALDKAIKLMEIVELFSIIENECEKVLNNEPKEKNAIIVGKYLEGDNPHPDMEKEDYYKFKYHKAYRLKGVPQDGLIFNCGIISRKFMLELGGWDAENFETTTCAHADLGIRALKSGAKMVLMESPMFKCSHEPKRTGTHGPIHDAMNKHDLPNFKKMYEKPNQRINIDLDNWKKTSEVWKERFGK